ncbi:MAG TPA: type II toxin-antitoxin system RelE/ParE family toxin [Burkholderiales bacterium]|nr:type II toxin-antitoxin system RelE/ParE family toxin [Burkholderiales bacterium]
MAGYKLLIKTSAAKEIDGTGSKADRQKIVSKILTLAANGRPAGSEKLAGHDNRYRLRQGNYRIIYLINDDTHEITIFKIGHRKDVYR